MTLAQTGLTILWRGSLASCNYSCPYCPFAKTTDDRAALAADRKALERFSEWAMSRPYQVSILITPWGEGLIRNYYRDALVRLSRSAAIGTIAIQTNLSCSIGWLEQCDLERVALWTTYHPGETPRAAFLDKIRKLDEMGARYSVGVVGLNEHLDEISLLRQELPSRAYLWVNAYTRIDDYYTPDTIERLVGIDPLFELNNRSYNSAGRECRAGQSVISVLADGTARRCHFLKSTIGNIYDEDFEAVLKPRTCTASECRCHIGYSHMNALNMPELYGRGFLERRPDTLPSRHEAEARIAAFEAGSNK